MQVSRYKLTGLAKTVLGCLILIVMTFAGYMWYTTNPNNIIATTITNETPKTSNVQPQNIQQKSNDVITTKQEVKKDIPTINISLDEWIGWKPIIDANGGLNTAKGSIYNKLGINVNIKIINDATMSSNALIQKDIVAAGYTLNRLSFLMDKFDKSKTKIVVPYLCNNSSGGDGIISKKDITSVEQLVGKIIVLPRYSEAQTLVWWLLKNSSLTEQQIKRIEKDMVLVGTPDEAAKIFFAGKADAAATWQPYLGQAQDPNSNSRLLFSTKHANNLILDVITFRQDFYEANIDTVSKFIEGALLGAKLYTTELKYIKNTMPQMSDIGLQDLKDMAIDATLSDYATNLEVLGAGGLGLSVFNDMADIWKTIGETVPDRNFSTIFDTTALKMLEGKFSTIKEKTITFTAEQKDLVKDENPLLTKKIIIEFGVNSAQYKNQNTVMEVLRKVAEQCNIADKMILQIEGNTSSEGPRDLNIRLSYDRAKSVANSLKMFGVDPTRFIIIGNGPDKPVADNKNQTGRELNRRTEISFKQMK